MASALCRLVGEIDDARAEGLRVNESQNLLIAPFFEEALPSAHDDGMDHETELVEEPLAQQPPDEGAAADDTDVLARLPLELGDLLRDVSLDQRRVLPLEGLFQGRRDDVLGGVVQVVRTGEWTQWWFYTATASPEASTLSCLPESSAITGRGSSR
jgi:hypothetical protein